MTMWKFHEVEPLAALMLIPYLAWVTFAAYLTSTLISMNPQVGRCPTTAICGSLTFTHRSYF